jgi:hypothetical protein
MAPWNKLPKDLQKAILSLIVLYGSTAASGCCPPGPMICDPPPPPSVTPMICDPPPPPTTAPRPTATPTVTPMICDPPPPPSVTPMICDPPPPPSVAPRRYFQVRSFQMLSDTAVKDTVVQGTVVDQQGQPLESLRVTAQTDGAEIDTWTDHNGAFLLPIPEPGTYLIVVNGDESHGLPLELRPHDLAIIEWVEIGPQSQSRLPLAEIRAVDLIWEDGPNFSAETPWPDARYRWSTSGGTLDRSGKRVVWQPPAEPGRYLLQVVADWGHDGLAVDALVLVVEEDGSVSIC